MGKKRVFAALLALAVTVGSLVLPARAAFTDTTGHWAETAITKWSEEYSIINGYEDGTFRPDNSITRGAFAGILDRFLKFQSTSPAGTFSDLSGNYWEDAILKLHASGVYLGNNGQALAGDTITRQQAVTMIARAFNISGESATVYYLDADQVADYAKPYLAEMSALGYITDSSDGYFRPTDAITRAEIVTILDNMIEVLIQTSTTYTQDVEGTVMVNAAEGACLQDMTITGDLILAPGVTGTVTLENVTIQGAVRNFGSAVVTDLSQRPEEPEQPPAIQPGDVYTPSETTGEYLTYSNQQIPIYAQNIDGAMAAGIETGVYFFAQAITVEEAIEEADFVISLLEGHEIDGPVAYDWEMHDSTYRVYGTTPEMATACAVAFCERIEEAGYDAMVYAGQYVSYIKYDQGALEPYLSWYPEYKSESSELLYPTLYYHMDYWQYSSKCSVAGIGGNVDVNLQFIRR